MMKDLAQWVEVAEKSPITLFEQGWVSLTGDAPEIAAIFKAAAKKDPTNAVRLIQHIADRDFAKDVLVEAVRAFPSATTTYPQWREIFSDKPDVVKAVERAQRFAPPIDRARDTGLAL